MTQKLELVMPKSQILGQNQLKQDHPRCNDRITINGILFVLSVGCR